MYIAVVLTCPCLYNFMQMISNFSISPNGRYVVAVMDNGNINVYSVPALSQHFTKVFCTVPCVYCRPIKIREFLQRRRQRQRQRERQTAVGLLSNTTSLHVHHAFLYISLPFLHDYDAKMPKFSFYGGRKEATTKLFFLFLNWRADPKKSTPAKFAYIRHFQQIGLNATNFEKMLIRFKSDVFTAVAIVNAETPYYCMLLLDAYCRPTCIPCAFVT